MITCYDYQVEVSLIQFEVAGNPTSRMPFISAGIEILLCNNFSLKCKQKSLSFAATSSDNCADECLHGISGGCMCGCRARKLVPA